MIDDRKTDQFIAICRRRGKSLTPPDKRRFYNELADHLQRMKNELHATGTIKRLFQQLAGSARGLVHSRTPTD